MSIQWYPGHMHKAKRDIKQILPKVDLLIEVLDARIPFSSENPIISEIRGEKPSIKVLAKTDLADPAITQTWREYLEQAQGVKTLALTTKQPGSTHMLLDICRKIVPHKCDSVRNIQAMVVGIPNVGKSTLINLLVGKAVAKTGNQPALTQRQQFINLKNGIALLDTPGILWPKVENANSSYRLAAVGTIKDTAMDYSEVAMFVADYLLKTYPNNVVTRYKLDPMPKTPLALLEQVGERRGCLVRGGKINLHKVSELILKDLRSGALGPISLETPAMIERENLELAEIKAQKEQRPKKNPDL